MLGGELRQGALDGVMVEAIAKAAAVPAAAVRRAHMLSGDLGITAEVALIRSASRRSPAIGLERRAGRCSRCWRRRRADVADGAGGDR